MSNDEILGIIYLVVALILIIVGLIDMKLSTAEVEGDDIIQIFLLSIVWPLILIIAFIAIPISYVGTKLKKWLNKNSIKD